MDPQSTAPIFPIPDIRDGPLRVQKRHRTLRSADAQLSKAAFGASGQSGHSRPFSKFGPE
jgi:hypothetical protein